MSPVYRTMSTNTLPDYHLLATLRNGGIEFVAIKTLVSRSEAAIVKPDNSHEYRDQVLCKKDDFLNTL